MKQILGLHIGTESIGWSLIRKSKSPRIVDMGTRIFSSFVYNLGEGDRESSSATHRSLIRNVRKIYNRKVYRKYRLLFFLASHKLCPVTQKELLQWKNKSIKVLSSRMDQWFNMNPYLLRQKGLTQKLSLYELGRVLYHFTQRRGKIMNDINDNGKAKVLLYGLPSSNRIGIIETQEKLAKQHLGEYFHSILPQKGSPYVYTRERIRNRYLSRRMFLDELKAILDFQKSFHKLVSDSFINDVMGEHLTTGIIYHQSPANYKKNGGMLSKCPFENTKKRLLKSHPLNEWYMLYSWLDSIKLYGEKLTDEHRKIALKVALQFSSFMFKKVRVALGIEDVLAFNYEDSSRVVLSYTLVQLLRKSAFGDTFLDLSEENQHELWHDLHFYTNKKMLRKRLQKKWGLSESKSVAVSDIKLKSGYGALSMKATRNILAYLTQGFDLRHAIAFAGIKNAIGQKQWSGLERDTKKRIEYFMSAVLEDDNYTNTDFWVEDFRDVFGIDLILKKLYNTFFKKNETLLSGIPFQDQEILKKYKPVAQKPMFELRKLVNDLIKEYGFIDQINVVLDNALKASAKQRKLFYVSKKLRNKELPKIYNAVLDAGQNPTHSNLMKYKLWLEWNKTCPYTNFPISQEKLFSDEVRIVYIHPWERFLNDSERNKTLCMRHFVPYIKGKTPYEYFSSQPSGVWERVKTRVLSQLERGSVRHMYFQRYRHFTLSNYSNDSISLEFNDQHQMALKLKDYLGKICPDIISARGNAISSLRRKWGISNIHANENTTQNLSAKETAVNALVIALNEPKYLKELKKWNQYEYSVKNGLFPVPWTRFKQDVLQAALTISVSYDVSNKAVRKSMVKTSGTYNFIPKGKLHKESFYGFRKAQGIQSFHIRKKINTITTAKQVSKIVDDNVRELVYDQIDLCGGFVKGKIPKNALTTPTQTGWETTVFLPNRRGENVPVRSVRIRENVSNAVQLQKGINKYVNPRKNHHVVIYKTLDNKFDEEIVSFWEAVRRVRNNEPLYQLPPEGRLIISTLHINDCFILGLSHKEIYRRLKNGENLWNNVYRVQRLSSKYYEFRQIYDLDVYNQVYPKYIRILNFGMKKTGWKTHNPFKISISVLGKITPFYKPLKVPESP